MAGAVLALVDGSAKGLPRAALAAASMAQRLSAEAGLPADIVLVDAPVNVPGRWRRSWCCLGTTPAGLVDELARIVAEGDYEAIIAADTAFGRETATRLAVRLGVPIVAPVLSLRLQAGSLTAVRPARSGAATATLKVHGGPLIAIAHADAAANLAANSPAALTPEPLRAVPGESPFDVVGDDQFGPYEMDVTEAEVVVAGGRGVGPHGFELLGELAALLGGSVGASRVAVDLGWAPHARQVGLTGKTVSPRLYVACGISGAIHHVMGMRDSGFIVAINTDPNAPILKIANVAIVGDLHEVLPAAIRELTTRRAPRTTAELVGAFR